jgi:hypothetical protein
MVSDRLSIEDKSQARLGEPIGQFDIFGASEMLIEAAGLEQMFAR